MNETQSRSNSTRPAIAHPQPRTAESTPVQVQAPVKRWQRRPSRPVLIAVCALIGLPALTLGILWMSHADVFTGIESNHYQMVQLTNGQFYFGKLSYTLTGQPILTDIYYIKDTSTGSASKQQSTSTTQPIELVKLGKEIHGPRDEMMISPYQLLYFENLNDDSQVVQTINSDKSKN